MNQTFSVALFQASKWIFEAKGCIFLTRALAYLCCSFGKGFNYMLPASDVMYRFLNSDLQQWVFDENAPIWLLILVVRSPTYMLHVYSYKIKYQSGTYQ